jgi:NADPH:quinone reductase-like Zn-dependent oxidoreductase
LAGLIAYTSLLDKAGAKAGNRVLINGGTGGVGIWAIQIAKAIGCYVVVTCSEKSIDLVKSYGADECMNYKQENLSAALAQRYGNEDAKFDVLFAVSTSLRLQRVLLAYGLKVASRFLLAADHRCPSR